MKTNNIFDKVISAYRPHACSKFRKNNGSLDLQHYSLLVLFDIISETTRILSQNISAILPDYNTLQRIIQKIRKSANMPYPFPRRLPTLLFLMN
ncbi:hypothetical protein HZS_3259 [Henneguya salminicola]|nr:hypothetical protein HZS_3259 [Henneguya salminicola]